MSAITKKIEIKTLDELKDKLYAIFEEIKSSGEEIEMILEKRKEVSGLLEELEPSQFFTVMCSVFHNFCVDHNFDIRFELIRFASIINDTLFEEEMLKTDD